MVCLWNICRSPLAEGILTSKVSNLDVEVDSAGTAAYHIGKKPDVRSIAVARKYGIDITSQRARQFKAEDFKIYDYIFAMDEANYRNIILLASSDDEKSKVGMIMNELFTGEDISVPDPYYGGDQGFENVYQMLDEACDKIVENIKNGKR